MEILHRATVDNFYASISQMSDGSKFDEIAVGVHQLLQAVPDDCENPQTLVLMLAQRVQDCRQGGSQLDAASSSTNTAARDQLIQSAFRTLDPKAQAIMRLQLSEGSHYRAIAERLNMQPAHVLRILSKAYVQLRWHAESAEAEPAEPAEPMTKGVPS